MKNIMLAIKELEEFNEVIDKVLGVYLDSILGFSLGKKHIENGQKFVIEQNPDDANLSSIEFLDKSEMYHGEGDPRCPDSEILHKTTQKEYKERNTEDSVNFKFIANMSLISIYQYWEDRFRGNIASHLGIEKNDYISPIMGDIRHVRISILHKQSRCSSEVEKCTQINWFREGDEVIFTKEQFKHVVALVKIFINSEIVKYSE